MKVSPVFLACLLNASAVNAFLPVASSSSALINKNGIRSSINKASATSTATTLQMADSKGPFDFLSDLLPKGEPEAPKEVEKPKLPDVVIDPSYNIAVAFGAVGIAIVVLTQGSLYGIIQGGITLLFASFLAVQATRIRFVFDETSFELKNAGGGDGDGDEQENLISSGENFVVGGENRWRYDSFVNYDFFPNRGLPILVYFKETQTPEEQWNEGPGMMDEVGGGQLHFFPAIANVDQLKEQFALRDCAKIEE